MNCGSMNLVEGANAKLIIMNSLIINAY
jgi:hypothetical protein